MILEIIELRTIDRKKIIMNSRLMDLILNFEKEKLITKKKSIKLYCNATISTDLSIHIIHFQNSLDTNDLFISHQIRNLLDKWGLINYTIWKEEK